jgi:hypothetical protein
VDDAHAECTYDPRAANEDQTSWTQSARVKHRVHWSSLILGKFWEADNSLSFFGITSDQGFTVP